MLYMDRRRALVNAIQIQMGDMLEVIGAEAGMHLVALLPTGTNDGQFVGRLPRGAFR